MKNIPEGEARDLLSSPSECLDIGDWQVSARSGHVFKVECGLVKDGVFNQLHVEIIHSYRPDVKVTHMKFTVFKKTPYGVERVFQLDINDNPLAAKNEHNLPHCHWGKERINGDPQWSKWTFEQALKFFMAETNIKFVPPLLLPGFKLK